MILLAISNGWKTAIMITAMILVFYIFIIRPQSQQAKKEEEYRNSLKKGNVVMLANGLHVTIVSVDTDGANANQALVELAPGTRIKVAKATLQPIPERKKSKK